MTTLKDLQALAAPSRKPVKKDITYKMDGNDCTATIHVRRLSIKAYENLYLSVGADKNRMARTISEAILVGEKGDQPIPLELAEQLPPAMAAAMVEAFNEVNVTKKS